MGNSMCGCSCYNEKGEIIDFAQMREGIHFLGKSTDDNNVGARNIDFSENEIDEKLHYPKEEEYKQLEEIPEFFFSDEMEKVIKKTKAFIFDEDDTNEVANIQKIFECINEPIIYVGTWKYGKPHGKGKLYNIEDGSFYEGHIDDGRNSGKGRKIFQSGDMYEGHFLNNKFEGEGKYTNAQGLKIMGKFKDNMIEGIGREIHLDGSSYTGEFKNGQKCGKGKFIWPIKVSEKKVINEEDEENPALVRNDEVYEGEFKDNEFNGQGIYQWTDGRKYEGTWENGKMHGKGEFTWKDGRKYIGDYINDIKNGNGEFVWPDGRSWKGKFLDGRQHGKGVLVKKTEEGVFERKGIWENGKRVEWLEEQTKNMFGSIL